ncbi:MAG: molybdopterin-guanine dinucleotide biosynthesis protein B [Pseudomonadota bacterium]
MPPVIAIVGHSDAGKTTLIEKLLPELSRRGYRVATVKHAHHGFQMDKPGKDSWRHQAAGAATVILIGPEQVAVVKSQPGASLEDALPFAGDCDLVIVEGFKKAAVPKIEVFRSGTRPAPICLDDPHLAALVTDAAIASLSIPVIGLDDIARLADVIAARLFGPLAIGKERADGC